MIRMATLALAMMLSWNVTAATSKQASDKWLREFRALQWKTTDALFLRDGTRQKFTEHRLLLESIANRAPTSACSEAAKSIVVLWDLQLDARNGDPIRLTAATRQGLTAGEWSASCNQDID